MVKKSKKENEVAPNTAFNPLLIESKNCSTVVLMLNSEEVEVLAKACEAISRFALKSEENKVLLHSLGTIEKLIPLLKHEDKHVKRYSSMAYAIMSKNADVRIAMRKYDKCCMHAAVLNLSDDDEIVVEFAALFLANMAVDFVNKKIIRSANAIEYLINHVNTSSDPDIQKNSLDCLSLLIEDLDCRTAVRDANVVPCLMDKFYSDYPAIQQVALKTTAILVQDEIARKQFRELEGMDKVLPLLVKKFADLHMVSLHVLSNCMVDPEAMDEIRNSGGIDQLLAFINENYPTMEVKLYAAEAIGRAAKNERNARILHEQNIEQALITMLNAHIDIEDIVVAVCETIAVISNNVLARETFGVVDGIPLLVALIPHENSSVSQAACLALANITLQNLHNSQDVLKAGGVDFLIAVLQNDIVAVNAAACITNMSAEITVRQEILKHPIMTAITQALQSKNPLVQSKVAEMLASLVDGAGARELIVQYNVLDPLVALLRSNNAQVLRNTCQALIRCIADPHMAQILLRIGIDDTQNEEELQNKFHIQPFVQPRVDKSRTLDLLNEINMSEARRTNLSVLTFEKLIEANISAKYSVINKLAARDIIGCHFYDPGKLRRGGKFVPLEILGKQPLNSNRAILLVNYKLDCDEPDELKDGKSSSASNERRSSNGDSTKEARDGRMSKSSGKRKKKDKETLLREEQERLQREKEEQERLEQEQRQAELLKDIYQPPIDDCLIQYIDEILATIVPLPSNREQVIALGQYVSSCMGGEIERERMLEFGWQLHVAELKYNLNSNVVPIGYIKSGTYFHRALLYKVLADRIGIPCTLVRGDYNLAWNEVMISPTDGANKTYPPQKYIIDLMHDAGRLIRDGSPEAHIYQTI